MVVCFVLTCPCRWRGSRIRVGVAKGDYLERLKAEWKEAEEVQASAQAVLSEMAAVAKDPAKRKSPPVLRLRRRPGELDTMSLFAVVVVECV